MKKNKNQSYESILEELKMELNLIKEDEKEQRLAAKKNREEGNFPAENQSWFLSFELPNEVKNGVSKSM